ncbi:hypothetical protein HRI_001808500 [Hibiscus trionum]|uniref:Uncharacterized protein n=1 Tax=Hibiscus trionum TaxID=183268 RepID=A0A9W7LXE4_HIBTR|nr:hypothetical protein HRI_001808500 [Hibiscus trionum]
MIRKEDLKSPGTGISGDISGKLNVFLTDSDDGSDLSYEGLVEEEKVEEIMQELYKEITSASNTSPPTTVRNFSFPIFFFAAMQLLSPLTFFPVHDVIKISESCGASMSDSSSTVMAGVEFVGPTKKMPSSVKGGLPPPEKELRITDMGFDDNNNVVKSRGAGKREVEKMESSCCDEEGGEVDDDQWLARVLGWGPLELEEWT